MRLRILLIFFIIIVYNFKSYTQIVINGEGYYKKQSLGIVGGITGFQSNEIELGLGYNHYETRPKNKTFVKPFVGASLSALYYPTHSELKGANFSVWGSMLFDIGLTQSYYEKGDERTWATKPFIGLGIYGISFTYGYNFYLTKNEMEELSNHVFAMRYFFPIIGRKKTLIHKK